MATGYQVPRNSLAWMLAAQVAVIAPHATRLVPWILAACGACAIWRIMIYKGRWSYPKRWAKAMFVAGGMIGVPAGYGRHFFRLEPAVALLIVAFVLKLLEMQRKRDAFLVIYLAYFVAATEFLFYQTIPAFIYVSAVVVMITAALIGLNQTLGHHSPLHTLRLSGTLLAQSAPLMIALFIFFPRIGPLWTVPLQTQTGRTGIADRLTLGDIATLTRSPELAFRVTFDGAAPPRNQLYWRGIVMTGFDGRTWTQSRTGYGARPIEWANTLDAPWDSLVERRGGAVSYSVILEPTNQNWIFALPTPVPLTPGIGLVRDFRLYSRLPIQSRTRYDVTSWLDHRTEREISDEWRYRTTLLPPAGNPLARRLAARLRGRSASDREFINRVMLMFADEGFVYTLRPGTLGDNAIDEFLFESRRGFCEHYASSFVFLMRAAGIPARVVVGYLGGEFNPIGNYYAIRQFDAHAWAEVWLEGEGWRRVDPTSAVAPERIESGLEAAVEEENTFLEDSPLSWLRYHTLWLTELRLQLETIGHYWDAWIVGYNPTMQFRFLGRMLGELSAWKMGIALFVSCAAVLLIVALALVLPTRARALDAATREYLTFCRIMGGLQLARERGEGPLTYAERIRAERPDLAASADRITRLFVDLKYRDGEEDLGVELKRAVRALRIRSLTANA